MRRAQAILVVFALLVAPLALVSGASKRGGGSFYCAAILWHRGACVVQAGRCMHSEPTVQQGENKFVPVAVLAPLTQMTLPRLLPGPAVRRSAANIPAPLLNISCGFLPTQFHPPRG